MTNVEINYEDQCMQFETRTHVGFSPGVGIRRLLLEGGGKVNGGFLQAGLRGDL